MLLQIQELQAISLSQKGIATNNLSFKHRGEGNSLFTQKQHREKHRSNNPSPFPVFERLFAVLFNGAGSFAFRRGITIAKGNFKYSRHCQNYNKRPLLFRDKARKIRASESRGQIYLYYAERRRICAKRNV